MDYNTYAPDSTLSSFVKCFWTLESPATSKPERQRIVPDGCMEMIFHYGDAYRQYIDADKFIVQPKSFVFGQITTALEIEPTGSSGIVAARFQPDGFIPFATMPVREMENRAVSLAVIFGEDGTVLENEVLAALNNKQRIGIIETFLLKKLLRPEAIDLIAKSSVAMIMQLNGQLSIGKLTEELNINQRQLERRFASTIGLSPKQLAKIVRLQTTMKMLEKKQFTSLTSLAYENGYFDQAHFIKDFKEFTGMSPKQFYAGNLKMSALFIGTD